jgi:hypothetical protein
MSYARFGWDGDVYVFMTTDHLECCACSIVDENEFSFRAYSTGDMVKHLWEHQRRGDQVSEDTFMGLWLDDAENFPNKTIIN